MKRKICSILTAIGLCLLSIVPATASHYRQRASHYRVHYVTRHRHSGAGKKVMTIAAPIAIGAAFGPAGSIGYQGVKHRRFIGHHWTGHRRSDTTQLTISTTPLVVEELRELVQMGHYGKNPAEAAERVLAGELHKIFGEDAVKLARKSLANLRRTTVSSARRSLRGRRGKR